MKNHCDWTVLDKFVFARQWITAEACLGAHTGSTPEFYLFVTTIKPQRGHFLQNQQCLTFTFTFTPRTAKDRLRSQLSATGGLFQLEKSLSPIDRKWLYVINLNFFVWRHECHRFLLKFWLKQIFSCLTPN